jgi:Fe-S-cluster containining protein
MVTGAAIQTFVKTVVKNKTPWYVAGLHFECLQCGACCAGPGAGYIWVTRPELELIAEYLKVSIGDVHRNYIRRVGLRTTIIEQQTTKDCIFLRKIDGRKRCIIYPVRPSQCRSWPFWAGNLAGPDDWNRVVQKCPGVNRGRKYNLEQIKQIKSEKKWWLAQ